MNNINGHGGGRRSAMASMDFYRRVPKDLTEVSVLLLLDLLSFAHMIVYIMAAEMIEYATMWFCLPRRRRGRRAGGNKEEQPHNVG